MEDNDKFRKPHYPRRNGPFRPPPGVQKAIQNFGVKDLREILDKKQQGKFEDDKKPEPKENRPPPDPPYNYLKDPTRDSSVQPEDKHHLPQRGNQRPRNEDSSRKGQPRNRDQQTISERHSSAPHATEDRQGRASKKELRFMDPVDDNSQDMRGEKSDDLRGEKPQDVHGEKPNFRGRSHRRGHNPRHTEPREERLENLVNIKVELSTETGHRNCVLDESTKIPDLKYIPDQHRKPRGRGSYRGRGRGRGSFRGRKEMSNRSSSEEPKQSEAESPANASAAHSPEIATDENPENAEPEEFVDSNENYDDSGYVETNFSHQEENEQPKTAFDASLVEAITITSQKLQDGGAQRAVEGTATKESETNENLD
ncbi:thyroid hormone receptor-associated protein 3 [Dendroctonus ponderosae]|uniref:Uncharacterized protein n=1 Tax=Dendroctonus ponderosae TaxID=77166 RepID=U4UT12_DENPD|nr:thyroid hormone receptor-associated protein 3 [Dendroctonus ponderosae]ERL93245.1 hypothetical protein D910_10541 [Dendroctonus ponderosae]KAH1010723.1 hypothetical protein HUJ05_004976 [Dendroctonus ponderosae]